MYKARLRYAALIILTLSLSMGIAPATAGAASPVKLNGHLVAPDFANYWNAHGGLRINGLPITDENTEVSLTDGKSYAVQWFERTRYERHPENPAGQQVLLGLLGTSQVEGRSFDFASDPTSNATRSYFPVTRHSLSNTPAPFKDYWEGNGGLAQFGYPLSEQIQETSTDGRVYIAQYFERQRFEYHPEQSDPSYKVELGLLGNQQYKQQFVTAPSAAAGLSNSHDTITIGISQEPDTLFAPAATALVSGIVIATINRGLIGQDDRAAYYPEIAAYVPGFDNGAAQFIGADGPDQYLQIKWKLRRGIKWADGVPVTAHDFVYAWRIYANPNVQVTDRTGSDQFSEFVATDDYTLVGKMLSENQARALYAQAPTRYAPFKDQHGPVVNPLFFAGGPAYPEHAYALLDAARLASSDYARAPLGDGPYRVRQWVPGQAIILEPNPYYSITPDKPAFKLIVFKIVEDTNQLLAQLQTGQIDMAAEDSTSLSQVPQLDEIARQGQVKPYYLPSTTWEHIDFNLDNPLFSDVRVRQAFAHAINRQGIVDKVLYGKTVVAHSWITPNIPQFYNSDVPKYEYNPDLARAMLAAAGYTPGPDGVLTGPGGRMSFPYITTAGNAYRQAVTQLVAADLKAVGVDAELKYIPSQELFAPDGPLNRRSFAFAEYAWLNGPDPGGEALYSSVGIPSADNAYSGQNYPGWRNAENDQLLHAVIADRDVALDSVKRAAAYKQEQKLFAQDLPTLPLHLRLAITLAPVGLKNYRPDGFGGALTWNIQEWRW